MSVTQAVQRMTPEERREFARLVQIAGTLPLEFMKCRLVKHSWDAIPVDIDVPFGRPIAFQCDRCGTKRYDCFDTAWGNITYRKYVYSDGYLLTESDGNHDKIRMPIAAVRLAYGRAIDA